VHTQAIVLKLHEQLGTPPPPQGAWRHHFDKEKEKEKAKRALKAEKAKRNELKKLEAISPPPPAGRRGGGIQ
tara:strand:+ start:257 stop:472 length:216 start_codon:yes stop_codon:yes gene_type:complete